MTPMPGQYSFVEDTIPTVKLPPPAAPSERTRVARQLLGLSKAVQAGYGDLESLAKLLATLTQ